MHKLFTSSISSLPFHLPNRPIPQNPHYTLNSLLGNNDISCIDWSGDNVIAFCTTEGIFTGSKINDPSFEQLRETLENQLFAEEEKRLQPFDERIRQEERDIITTGPENLQETPPKRPLSSRLRKLLIASTNALATNPQYANCFLNEVSATNSPNSTTSNPSLPNPRSTQLLSTSNASLSKRNTKDNNSENTFKSNISSLTQVIYILSPNSPNEFTTLISSHRSRIRILSFSPVAFGPLLISSDESDNVCVWSMKNHCSNEWFCLHSFSIPQVINTFWVPLCKYSLPIADSMEDDSIFINKFLKGYYLPQRLKVPAFFTISTSGLVKLIYKRMFEDRWSALTLKLKKTIEKLSHCDMIFLPDNETHQMKAILAVIGQHPNRIYFFELQFNFGPVKNPSLHCSLKSQLGFHPSHDKDNEESTSDINTPGSFVTHLKFEHVPSLIPPILLVTSNGSESKISRWEFKDAIQYIDPLFSKQDTITKKWVQTHFLIKQNITSFNVFENGDIVVGYLDSSIELLNSNLEIISSISSSLSQNQNKKLKIDDHLFDDNNQLSIQDDNNSNYAVSIALSPNQSCFSVLDSKNQVHIYLRETTLPQNHFASVRQLADLFELSLLQCTSNWDLLLLTREQSYQNSQVLLSVCCNLLHDLSLMDSHTSQYYYPLFQSVVASLLRLKSQVIAYVDCQIRIYVEFLLDMITSCLQHVSLNHQNDIQFDGNYQIEKSVDVKVLIPHTEWILDFTIFFANNINKYLNAAEDCSPGPFKHAAQSNLQSFFIMNESMFPSLPCLSLLYDEKFMKDFLTLLVYCNAVRRSDPKLTDKKFQNIKKMHTEIEKLFNLTHKPSQDYTMEYFIESKKTFLSKTTALFINSFRVIDQAEYDNLYLKLELFPPLVNFLDQNQLSNHRKRKAEYNYRENPNVHSKYDVVTRLELSPEDRFICRQCMSCNRLSKLPMLSDDIDLWQRWEFACPLCFGKWKILRNVK